MGYCLCIAILTNSSDITQNKLPQYCSAAGVGGAAGLDRGCSSGSPAAGGGGSGSPATGGGRGGGSSDDG